MYLDSKALKNLKHIHIILDNQQYLEVYKSTINNTPACDMHAKHIDLAYIYSLIMVQSIWPHHPSISPAKLLSIKASMSECFKCLLWRSVSIVLIICTNNRCHGKLTTKYNISCLRLRSTHLCLKRFPIDLILVFFSIVQQLHVMEDIPKCKSVDRLHS